MSSPPCAYPKYHPIRTIRITLSTHTTTTIYFPLSLFISRHIYVYRLFSLSFLPYILSATKSLVYRYPMIEEETFGPETNNCPFCHLFNFRVMPIKMESKSKSPMTDVIGYGTVI